MAYNRTLQHFISGQEVATLWSGPGSNYLLNQLVIESQKLYLCLVSHTSSSSFLTDLASGKWEEVSASEAGVFNYIGNGSAEVDTTGWSTYADAAGTQPVDGTGGSPSITWTRSETSPLRGVADFNLTKDAANRQGQGVSYDFTIDPADKAKVLSVTFDYEVLSGTYADGDLTVYLIADPTGTPVVIQPAGYTVLSATAGTTMVQSATFQTQATGTSYRLCFHVASTSASAYTLAIDNIVVGPQTVVYGSPVTDWESYTPTFGGAVSRSAEAFKWRRVGDSIEIVGSLEIGTAPTPVTGTITFTLPTGYALDTAKMAYGITGVDAYQGVGDALARDSSPAGYYNGKVARNLTSTNTFYIVTAGDTATNQAWNATAPFSWTSTDNLLVSIKAPIEGWSSSVQMSNDTDTRVVAAYARGTPSSSISGSVSTVIWGSTIEDSHGAYSSGTGVYTVPVSGFYKINARTLIAGTFSLNTISQLIVRVDASNAIQEIVRSGGAVTSQNISITGDLYLTAGQTVDIQISSAATSPTFSGSIPHIFSIQRLSGPATIAASETVAMYAYELTGGDTIGTGATDVIFSDKLFDSHNSYNSTTGIYTIPVSGKYAVVSRISTAAVTLSTTQRVASIAVKNGATVSGSNRSYGAGVSREEVITLSGVFDATAGDEIKIQALSSVATPVATATVSGANYFSIYRIGN